jgi:branched-chain amino acid transport system permease protein
MSFFVIQFISGLASAASLFLVASGLSVIFGVSRIVNFAHGSFAMLGAYAAYSLVHLLPAADPWSFWLGIVLAALLVGAAGGVVEMTLLRRLYRAPELLQLLATFGVVLIVQDLVLDVWGPEDLLGPRAPGLKGAVSILGQPFPQYDLVLVLLGPLVLAALWSVLRHTRWGILVRAATQDREMVAALGVNQGWLSTSVFVLGTFLAALGGAVQLPREAVNHVMDMQIITEAFVIVVIGGLGNVIGAFLAAIVVGELNAFGLVIFPQITLMLTFLIMAIILILRPWGLLGKPDAEPHGVAIAPPIRPFGRQGRAAIAAIFLILLVLPLLLGSYGLSVASEVLIFALFAASLHFVMSTGGMISFGHAAYFGLGAYGAALSLKTWGLSMLGALAAGPLLAAAAGLLFGWFCVRLSGVYLAMLTLAFAQIAYAVVFQWSDLTGGDNGLIGIWPAPWASSPAAFYYLCLALCGGGLLAVRRVTFAPFGYALRACRDSTLRADAIGIDVDRHRWLGFALGGAFAGVAGALYAFLKGSIFPDTISIAVSMDGLVMVLLGGVQSLIGPVIGAALYTTLHIVVSSLTDQWRTVLGIVIITLVTAFPQGIGGLLQALLGRPTNGKGAPC